ncbi:hypothetical protein ACXIUT_20795 [Achromobacter denitrificans]
MGLIVSGKLLIPDSELTANTKKILNQAGLAVLYIASLSAGYPFVWNAKTRRNKERAEFQMSVSAAQLEILKSNRDFLGKPFDEQIQAADDELAEAQRQLDLAESMPKFYDWAGMTSLCLVAIGTCLCIIGAG